MVRKLVFSAAAVGLGVMTFVVLIKVSKDATDPLIAACVKYHNVSIEEFVEESGYHAYSKEVGFGVIDPYTCFFTNFLLVLVENSPGGLINWFATMNLITPLMVLWLVEAGRARAAGPVRYPMITNLLGLLLGVSVAFPLFWIPSYVFGRGKPGTVSPSRAWTAFAVGSFTALQTIPVFVLDADGFLWRIVAGLVLSYAYVPLYIAFWFMPPTDMLADKDATVKRIQTVARAYTFSGMFSFFIWMFLIYFLVTEYGTDYEKLWNDVFGTADGMVKFMFVDFTMLWIGMLTLIAYHDMGRFVEAFAFSFVFGPGSAIAASLAELELSSYKAVAGKKKD